VGNYRTGSFTSDLLPFDFFGLPWVLFLQRRGKLKFTNLAISGFVIGAVPSTFLALIRNSGLVFGEPLTSLKGILGLGLIGMVGGVAFFLVWDRQST